MPDMQIRLLFKDKIDEPQRAPPIRKVYAFVAAEEVCGELAGSNLLRQARALHNRRQDNEFTRGL